MNGDAMIDVQGAKSAGTGLVELAGAFIARRPVFAVACAAIALTVARIVLLAVTDVNLGPDEAQYWVWSWSLDWGYFSKPPLIAWIIAATTSVFGQAEWAIRLAAPLFHMGGAILVAALGRRLFDGRVALWAGLGWLTLPGVVLSSLLITTDAPLLFFWSLGLLLFFAAAEPGISRRRRAALAAALGIAVGLGMMAKYAMIYFAAGAVLALVFAPEIRRMLSPGPLALAAAIAAVIVAPNLWWNAQHGFQTLNHTAANANWSAAGFRFDHAAGFLGAQFGVFGPIFLILFLWGLVTLRKRINTPASGRELALLAFALPPLAIVTGQAFISRAHANWAATAYPSALLLVVAWSFRAKAGAVFKAGVGLHLVGAAAFMAAVASFSFADAVGAGALVKRVRGWDAQGADIARAAAGYDAVVVDDRELMGSLLYYARSGPPIVSWNSNGAIDSHYEAKMAFDPTKARRALFVTKYSDPRGVVGAFDTITPKGEITAALGGSKPRTLYLFELVGPKN